MLAGGLRGRLAQIGSRASVSQSATGQLWSHLEKCYINPIHCYSFRATSCWLLFSLDPQPDFLLALYFPIRNISNYQSANSHLLPAIKIHSVLFTRKRRGFAAVPPVAQPPPLYLELCNWRRIEPRLERVHL